MAKLTNTYTEIALDFLLESAIDALRIKTRELIVFHNTMNNPANGEDMTKALQNKGWDVTASELEVNNLICVIKKHNKKPDVRSALVRGEHINWNL